MKKYIIIIVWVLIFVNGCSVKYNINIDKKGIVSEEATVLELNKYLGANQANISKSINIEYGKYRSIIEFKDYNSKTIYGQDESGFKLDKTYKNICDYVNYNAASLYIFESMVCNETDEYYEIKNSGQYLGGCYECMDEANTIDKLYITFNLPKKAISSNADKVIGNKYIWIIDRETTQNKSFVLKIDKSTFINNKVNSSMLLYIFVGIIMIPILFVVYKIIIKTRNNEY